MIRPPYTLARPVGPRLIHASVVMVPNPWRALELFMGGVSRLPPFVRDPARPASSYQCRTGQVRGKANVKRAKRLRQAEREIPLYLQLEGTR